MTIPFSTRKWQETLGFELFGFAFAHYHLLLSFFFFSEITRLIRAVGDKAKIREHLCFTYSFGDELVLITISIHHVVFSN